MYTGKNHIYSLHIPLIEKEVPFRQLFFPRTASLWKWMFSLSQVKGQSLPFLHIFIIWNSYFLILFSYSNLIKLPTTLSGYWALFCVINWKRTNKQKITTTLFISFELASSSLYQNSQFGCKHTWMYGEILWWTNQLSSHVFWFFIWLISWLSLIVFFYMTKHFLSWLGSADPTHSI